MESAAVTVSVNQDDERNGRAVGLTIAITGLALFALMGLLGLVMRLTQAKAIDVDPAWFYKIMTLHGSGMLVGALLALMGGLWYMLRRSGVELCAGRMIASYLSIVAGTLTVLVAIVFGDFATGWTFLWPLPFNSLSQWPEWAATTFLIGMVLVGAGFQLYCIEIFYKLVRKYGGLKRALGVEFLRNRDDSPPQPQEIAAVVVALVGLITSAAGVTILSALIGRAIDPKIAIDALWAKNLTYFYGHTIANLIIYLGAGVIYVLIPKFAGRPWKTTKPIVVGWLFTVLLVLTAFGHHLYMDFVQPRFASVIASIASFGAALPVAVVTIYTGLMLVWGSRYRWTLASTLLYIGFAGWAIGGVGAVIDSLIPVNFRFHNTLWVPAHFHTYMLMGAIIWVMALITYIFESSSGASATRFGRFFAPLLMVIGGFGLVAIWYIEGALGVPRRYAVQIDPGSDYSAVASVFVVIFAVGFLVLLFELVRLGRLAWAKRGSGSVPAAMAGGSPESEVALSSGKDLEAPVTSSKGFILAFVVALAAAVSILPWVISSSESSVQWHHFDHAAVFFLGSMIGVLFVSIPSVWAKLSGRFQNVGLAVVILAPAVEMIAMVPKFYSGLESDDLAHLGYHLIFITLGLVTAIGASRFGKMTAWVLIILSATMGFMYAGGVSSLV